MISRKHLLLFLFATLLFPVALSAQTVIDLHRGGAVVRAKSADDYALQNRDARQLREDSLQYIDCLTRAYNHLYADSLSLARECFLRALKLRPEAPANYIIHRELGKIYLSEAKFRESTEEFNQVLRQYPGDFEARRHRAVCALSLNHPQQALDDCRTLFQHATDTASAVAVLFLQAEAHRQLRQYPQVGEDISNILTMDPQNTGAQLLYAVNLQNLGQPQESLNRLNLYLAAHPQDAEALLARAELHLRQQHPILAREDADTAVSLSPSSPSAYLMRAKILDEIGLNHLADQDRRKALQLSGNP